MILKILAKRIALGIAAAWAVLTTVFLLYTVTDDWQLGGQTGLMTFAGVDEAEIQQFRENYLASRGLDRPVYQQYLDWMGNMLTLDWGESFATQEPVTTIITDATTRTLLYAAPGIAIAIVVGIAIGLYAALHRNSRPAAMTIMAAYILFAIPGFWIGGMLLSIGLDDETGLGYSSMLFEYVLPIALVGTTLIGGYASYARAHAREYATADFITFHRAKGAGPFRIARHVTRNAAIPFFSMLFTEALGLLILAVFVIEVLFGIDGLGLVLFEAIDDRDLPVIMGGTIIIIAAGVIGNIIQDVTYRYLDPRVE